MKSLGKDEVGAQLNNHASKEFTLAKDDDDKERNGDGDGDDYDEEEDYSDDPHLKGTNDSKKSKSDNLNNFSVQKADLDKIIDSPNFQNTEKKAMDVRKPSLAQVSSNTHPISQITELKEQEFQENVFNKKYSLVPFAVEASNDLNSDSKKSQPIKDQLGLSDLPALSPPLGSKKDYNQKIANDSDDDEDLDFEPYEPSQKDSKT